MNIPQDTLQQVADAAFLSSNGGMMGLLTCNKEKNHVFWHEERYERRAVIQHALDNPALAPFLAGEAIARAEKAEAELAVSREINQGLAKSCLEWGRLVQELKSSQLAILHLPAAEPTPPAKCAINHTEQNVQFRDAAGFCKVCGADWPAPTTQVPLGPEDYPPGSVLRFAEQHWYNALYVSREVICLVSGDSVAWKDWNKLQDDGWQINTSIPDTGRWDKDAWRPCSKPGKEVEK